MDLLFHGLTGLVISKGVTGSYLLPVAAFSILPDLLGVAPFNWYKFKRSNKTSFKEFLKDWLKYTRQNYFFSKWDKPFYKAAHSLLSLLLVAPVAFVLSQSHWWIFTLAYLSHLLIDIPGHQGEFASQPLWPISKFSFPGGKNWAGGPKIFFSFWFVLLVLFLLIHFP
jgi:hypothetical protein